MVGGECAEFVCENNSKREEKEALASLSMTTRITPGVGANLLGQHAAERNQDATAYVGNLDSQVSVWFAPLLVMNLLLSVFFLLWNPLLGIATRLLAGYGRIGRARFVRLFDRGR